MTSFRTACSVRPSQNMMYSTDFLAIGGPSVAYSLVFYERIDDRIQSLF